ncbi:hypothetical protein VP01_608g3 [Puccinia sorghi]|uniref:Uncharacterized protein n=1 Tax=Puccinia sorghi TaxID=27349 RepID=A0A0L6UH70_9BASI|nr:hypothetical protein VP01_608g3 [Puccinia sorghi]
MYIYVPELASFIIQISSYSNLFPPLLSFLCHILLLGEYFYDPVTPSGTCHFAIYILNLDHNIIQETLVKLEKRGLLIPSRHNSGPKLHRSNLHTSHTVWETGQKDNINDKSRINKMRRKICSHTTIKQRKKREKQERKKMREDDKQEKEARIYTNKTRKDGLKISDIEELCDQSVFQMILMNQLGRKENDNIVGSSGVQIWLGLKRKSPLMSKEKKERSPLRSSVNPIHITQHDNLYSNSCLLLTVSQPAFTTKCFFNPANSKLDSFLLAFYWQLPPGMTDPAIPAMWQLHSIPYPINTQTADLPLLCTPNASQIATSNPNSSPPEKLSRLNDRNGDGKSSLDLVVVLKARGKSLESSFNFWRLMGYRVKMLKINNLESKYWNAAEWSTQTGQGIQDDMEADFTFLSLYSASSLVLIMYPWAAQWNFAAVVNISLSLIRDQTSPEDRKQLGDIFTSTGHTMNHTDDDSPPSAEDIDNKEWPYLPTQELAEGKTQHALGATSEHADLTNESQTSGSKRKLTLDEDAECTGNPPASFGFSTIHSGLKLSANMITTQKNKTSRKTNKLKDKTLGNSIIKTLDSFARMNMPLKKKKKERIKTSLVVRKVQVFKELMSPGLTKEPMQITKDLKKTYLIDFFSVISTYLDDFFFNSTSAHKASNPNRCKKNNRRHGNQILKEKNFNTTGDDETNNKRFMSKHLKNIAPTLSTITRAVHQSHMPLLIHFCNKQHTCIHIDVCAAEFSLLITKGKLMNVVQSHFNTPIGCSTTTCCNDKRYLNFLCGRPVQIPPTFFFESRHNYQMARIPRIG